MIVYIDKDYCCHTRAAEGLRAVEVPFFDDKCSKFVEGYRYVPDGEIWIGEDGVEYKGEMLSPCQDYSLLHASQQGYESLLPRLKELREKLEAIAECFDGLAANPSFEQLVDLIRAVRELIED